MSRLTFPPAEPAPTLVAPRCVCRRIGCDELRLETDFCVWWAFPLHACKAGKQQLQTCFLDFLKFQPSLQIQDAIDGRVDLADALWRVRSMLVQQ